jgi:hypothetical protein
LPFVPNTLWNYKGIVTEWSKILDNGKVFGANEKMWRAAQAFALCQITIFLTTGVVRIII